MALELIESHQSFGGKQGVFRHESKAVASPMEFSVFIPEQANHEPLPVLYYLSGLTCTWENVTTKGGFQPHAAELGLIVVCPDTSPRNTGYPGEDDDYDFGSGAGFYLDATEAPWSKTYRMHRYIAEELPELIAENFPVDRKRSGIFGHSMGGHGALTIGLKYPNQFLSISAFSPIVAPSQVPWGKKAFTGYLGNDPEVWNSYDATELIKSGHKSNHTILIDQGTADPFLAKQLQPDLFAQACRDRRQPLTLNMREGYDHSYFFISTFMQEHIEHHAQILIGNPE